ncbi:hypothetical protein ACHQM5_019717 [Ranunculus cassubicifolius]
MIELHAILQGLMIAIQMGWKKMMVFTDSKMAASYVCGSTQPSWRCRNMVKRIQELIAKFDGVTVKHAFRETNGAADYLAGLPSGSEEVVIYGAPFPEKLCSILDNDANGMMYPRV